MNTKGVGRKEWLKVMNGEGESLTLKKAVMAKCYDCMAGYKDGRVDCELRTCSLYKWMPYRGDNVRN